MSIAERIRILKPKWRMEAEDRVALESLAIVAALSLDCGLGVRVSRVGLPKGPAWRINTDKSSTHDGRE